MKKSAAVDHFGSMQNIATALGITRSAVSQWSEIVPRGCAFELMFITGGRLQVDLRMYGPRSPRSPRNRRRVEMVAP